MQFDKIFQDVSKEYYKLKQVQSQLLLTNENITKLKEELIEDERQIQLHEKASEVFKTLQERLTYVHIDHLTNLINNALETVFNDEYIQYSIRIETSQQRNNNTCQFYLLTTENNITTETLLQDNGFGIQSLIGFVLQIYFILQHNQARILFLDESLTAISTDKLPKLKVFIDKVSQQYDFKFILIAHMSDLFELADYAYNVENGKVIEVTKGDV